MPKRRDLLKKIKDAASVAGVEWVLDHEGANHSVFKLDGLVIPVPRHNELGERLAEGVYKECQAKLGKGWWR